ncbi:class II glutamine amidotransferase [Gynuella sp.]|uniref:class II glutamine amidotransferase n=1 Tax=Gynuella sp. TaxID=2969146 RepID=UPI003D12AE6C
MCELLGMSASVPTDICFSFTGLTERGGVTGPHTDGWGIVFYEDGGTREFRDWLPSSRSRIAELVKQYPIHSRIVISHIRQANVGAVSLVNTHPFTRELWGKPWTFAHNGQMKEYRYLPGGFQPIGTTDSEAAFCNLLNRIRSYFAQGPTVCQELWPIILAFCQECQGEGVFNMLLSQGSFLFCFCSNNLHRYTRKTRQQKEFLQDVQMEVDLNEGTGQCTTVSVVATQPLTDSKLWQKMQPGEAVVFKDGDIVWHHLPD